MSERILITGAAGLIGYALGERLSGQGRQVIGVDQIAPDGTPPFEFVAMPLTDVHGLYALLHRRPVDAIVHAGAVSGPMVSQQNPYAIVQSNVVGTANILEAARLYAPRRVIYCSSCMTYGDTPPAPVDEDAPQRPSTTYAATKAGGELLARAYRDEHGLDTVSLRLSWVYGPRRRTACTIREMLLAGINDRPLSLPWGRGYGRQYVYLDDVLQALEKTLTADAIPRHVYNITGGERVHIEQIADRVRRRYPNADIRLGEGADPQDSVQELIDIGAAAQDLNYAPEVDIEQGIDRYADWLERR